MTIINPNTNPNTNVGSNKPGVDTTGPNSATGEVGKINPNSQQQNTISYDSGPSDAEMQAAAKAAADQAKRKAAEANRAKAERDRQKNEQAQQNKKASSLKIPQREMLDEMAGRDEAGKPKTISEEQATSASDIDEAPIRPAAISADEIFDEYNAPIPTDIRQAPIGSTVPLYDANTGVGGNVAQILDATQNYSTRDANNVEAVSSNIGFGANGQQRITAGRPRAPRPSVVANDVMEAAQQKAKEQSYRASRQEQSTIEEEQSEIDEEPNPEPSTNTSQNETGDSSSIIDADVTGEVRSSRQDRIEREQIHIDKISKNLEHGMFQLDGTDENGRYTKDVQASLVRMSDYFNIDADEWLPVIFEAVQHQLGISVDRRGFFFVPSDKNLVGDDAIAAQTLKVNDADFIYAIDSIIDNAKHGHPFIMRDPHKRIGNTLAIPCPFVSPRLYDMFTQPGSKMKKVSYAQMNENALSEWRNHIHPRIQSNSVSLPQRIVLETMARSVVEAHTTFTSEQTGLLDDKSYMISEATDRQEQMARGIGNKEIEDAVVAANSRLVKAMKTLDKHKYKTKKNADGSYSNLGDIKDNPVESFAGLILASERVLGTLDPTLAGSAVLERALGNAEHFVASNVMFLGEENKAFKPSGEAYIRIQEAAPSIKQYGDIASMMGQEAFVVFANSGMEPTPENVTRFAEDYIKREPSGPFAEKMKSLLNKSTGWVGNVISGDWFMRGSDPKRFLDAYMNIQAENKRNGLPYVTKEEVESALQMDPNRAVREMMMDVNGMRAFSRMRARTVGGNTILSEPIAQFFRDHKMCDIVFGQFVNKYATFGVRVVERSIPFIYTIELAMAKRRANKEGVDLDSLKYSELLVSRTFRDSLILDGTRLASNVGKLILISALMTALGFDEPDDPDNRGLWDEWKIGGCPMRQMWYLDDIFSWTAPLAVASQVMMKTGDLGLGWQVFLDGMCDTLGGLSPASVVDFVSNFDKEFVNAQMIDNAMGAIDANGNVIDPHTANDDIEFFTTMLAATSLEALSNAVVPRFLQSMFRAGMDEKDYDHSYTLVYTSNPNDDPDAVEATSFFDAQMRRITQKNPVLAFLFDAPTAMGKLFGNDTVQTTGYGYEEMPLRTMSDPTGVYTKYIRFGTTRPEGLTDEQWESELDAKVDDLLNTLIFKYDHAEDISALGVVLSKEMRHYADVELVSRLQLVWNDYHTKLATPGLFSNNGKSYEENQAAKNAAYNEAQAMTDYIKSKRSLLWSGKIPSEVPKYAMWRTNWQEHYTDQEGNEVPWWNYVADVFSRVAGRKNIDYTLTPYGDIRNPLTFGASSVVDRQTFDDLSPLVWWSDSWSDWDAISEFYQDAVLEMGTFAGKNVLDVITAEGQVLQDGDWNQVPVLGRRAYTALGNDYEDFDDYKVQVDYDALKNGTSSNSGSKYSPWSSYSGRTGYGSGSSYSYDPKIYSTSRSVNADKAQGMSVRQPYSATKTYLRPNFETKGSREAYRRSDF